MNWKMKFYAVFSMLFVLVGVCVSALADDSAASIAAGGLVARRETRIVMAKEVLRISDKKVIVDYDFRNGSDQDVTTEVAFPIPPYGNGFVNGPSIEEAAYQSFKLWVNGSPVHFESEAKATLKRKDVTAILNANRIDIATFGHFEDGQNSKHEEVFYAPDLTHLSKNAREQLVMAGLIDQGEPAWGRWTVHLQYHWTQTFPAHSTVHIRHEYTPVEGWLDYMPVEAVRLALTPGSAQKDPKSSKDSGAEEVSSFCPEPELLRGILHKISEDENDPDNNKSFPTHWVDFILTTANTWKQPIEDFTLIVERPIPLKDSKSLISFCSPANGKVEKLDADHFQVHLTNFVPAAELHIGFFEVPDAKSAPPPAKK